MQKRIFSPVSFSSAIPVDLLPLMEQLPADFRPAPLFVFNEEHEGVMGEGRVTEMLEKLKQQGFGGVYIHPRPGMITEYLSPRWFELVRHTVAECRRLGLVPHLYDENSYPSGFAGGHVTAEVPDTRSRYFMPVYGKGPANLPAEALAVFQWLGEQPGESIDVKQVTADTEWLAFVLRDLEGKPFLADGNYVSLVDPLAAQTFLKVTHDRYRAELSDEDWQALGSIFTDEPHLPGSDLGAWSPGLHGSHWILSQFAREYGYDLRERLADLYYDTPTATATRYDFYDLLQRMWMDNWARPLQQWCQKHGIQLTGHYHDHDWPAPYATPGQVHLLSALDWPGTDFLECFELLGHDFYDAQGFDKAVEGQEPFGLLYLKQVESVARQYGKQRVMDECWGAGGHDATPADWLRLGRYLAVHGVNHFVPHHCLQTISGARKQDHPQFFSDQIPVFDYLRPMNDELARLSAFGRQGKLANRILVLDPLTTGFVIARKADAVRSGPATAEACDDALKDSLRSLLPLREKVSALVQLMSDRLLDFDLGDEYVLEEIGGVDADCGLQVGEACYDCIVWPQGMIHLRAQTAEWLNSYLEQGGHIYGVRPDQFMVAGRVSEQLGQWERQFADQIHWFADADALCDALAEAVPPRLTFAEGGVLPDTGLALSYRIFNDNQPGWLLVNSHPKQALQAVPLIPAMANGCYVFNPADGSCSLLGKGEALRVPATEARLLFAPEADAAHAPTQPASQKCIGLQDLQWLDAQPVSDNVCVLDRCQLTVNGQTGVVESVQSANRRYWHAHGIPTNGWLMRGQTKGSLLKRDACYGADTGGHVRYTCLIGEATPLQGIRLVVERPELWQVAVNGQLIDFAGAQPWRDPRMLQTDIGRHLKHGENEITLSAEPFQVRQEIDAVYLLGAFALEPVSSGFAINGPLPELGLGAWLEQGMPFYDGAVDYRFRLPSDFDGSRLRIAAADWQGALVELRHGGRVQPCYGPDLEWDMDPANGEELTLRVVGLAKNLFGPWHIPFKPRKRAWSSFWLADGLTIDGPRDGKDYDLLPCGIF